MDDHRIYSMPFASVYPHYVHKVEKKGRTKGELDEVICWLTGYTRAQLAGVIQKQADFSTFFGKAPCLHQDADRVTGTVCGVRVEEVAHPLMRRIRILDKLVDELAKGRPLAKVLRQDVAPARPAAGARKKAAARPAKRGAAKASTGKPRKAKASRAKDRAAPRAGSKSKARKPRA